MKAQDWAYPLSRNWLNSMEGPSGSKVNTENTVSSVSASHFNALLLNEQFFPAGLQADLKPEQH
jgi:hypothetical protein